jgi:hypothetical protein
MISICLWDQILLTNKVMPVKIDSILEAEIPTLKSVGANILSVFDSNIVYSQDIVLAHIDAKDRECLFDRTNFPDFCIEKQIFILISSNPVDNTSRVIKESAKGKSTRIILCVNSLDVLRSKVIFNKAINLSFDDAEKIITAQSTYIIGWDADPFFPTPDIPIAVYILCQCYLYLYYSQSNQPQENTYPQILELLKNKELFGRASNDKFKTIKSSSWWKSSLTSEDFSWKEIKFKGEKQWQSLIKAQDDLIDAWDDLISQVNEEDVDISFEKVEAYYLKMHAILSTQ